MEEPISYNCGFEPQSSPLKGDDLPLKLVCKTTQGLPLVQRWNRFTYINNIEEINKENAYGEQGWIRTIDKVFSP